MKKDSVNKIFGDIRFWLIILFIIRLFGITNAPLEVGHNWRQSLTNMIARNFLEDGANIFFPMIDMAGEKTGIIGSEFPFFNYLIYLVAHVFDYSHWYGRLINLIITSIGIFYFYRLITKLLDKRVAFNATIILSTSIWFAFSRKIMPDTFSISILFIGLFYAYSFLKDGHKLDLLLFFVFSTLGMLCKIPALSLFSAVGVVILINEISTKRKVLFYITATVSFSIVVAWYFYWVPYLVDTYQYPLYFPKGIIEGALEIYPLMPELLEKFYFSSLHSYLGFACFIIGLFLFFRSRYNIIKLSVGIITVVFLIFILKTGAVFPLHNYYVIPFTPVMALLAAYFLTKIPIKFQYILLVIIAIESIANQQHDFFIKESREYKLSLEKITNSLISKNELIVINGGQSPQDIYFSNRKGWTTSNEQIVNPEYLDYLTSLGAKYLIIDKSSFKEKFNQYQIIFSNNYYDIYKLED